MTEHLKAAGVSLAAFAERHFTGLLSAIFAFGFVWAQFDGVRVQLSETRAHLRALSGQYNMDRSRIAADQRDLERLVGDVGFIREQLAEQLAGARALEGRIIGLETAQQSAWNARGRSHVE